MISYEIAISSIYISIIMITQSFSIADIVNFQIHLWFIFPLIPFWILYLICILAESNRTPFDLPEAEAELVAGYNVEYSAIAFALFFLAEYGNLLSISCISTLLFFGGWHIPFFYNIVDPFFIFVFKVCINVSFFLWTRATLPRYRYDHLLKIGWKRIIPICFSLLMLEASLLLCIS
jgi:NADH-quinone oxidoreductase subunit H